jgi:hypothetical protein
MTHSNPRHIFLSYSQDNEDSVDALARRLHGDAGLVPCTEAKDLIPHMSKPKDIATGLGIVERLI